MVTSACFSCRIWKFSPGDKIFQVVAQSLSSHAEILDGSFLQPHILLPPPLFPSYHRISSTSSSAASLHPALAGIAVEPAALLRTPPTVFVIHRLGQPSFSSSTFFCFFSSLPSYRAGFGRLTVRTSELMSRVLSTPSRPVVNYPWMSYARSTLILKLSKKNGKVSINPRSFVLRSEDRDRWSEEYGRAMRAFSGWWGWTGMGQPREE